MTARGKKSLRNAFLKARVPPTSQDPLALFHHEMANGTEETRRQERFVLVPKTPRGEGVAPGRAWSALLNPPGDRRGPCVRCNFPQAAELSPEPLPILSCS